SGTTAFDAVAAGGITMVTQAGSDPALPPLLTLPLGRVAGGSYVLVAGVARQFEPDGGLGPPLEFSLAFSTVDAPATLLLHGAAVLMVSGGLAVKRWLALRRRRT